MEVWRRRDGEQVYSVTTQVGYEVTGGWDRKERWDGRERWRQQQQDEPHWTDAKSIASIL
jgi:hypothetical protein